MKKKYHTYKKSGVNISTADKFVKFISVLSKKTINQKTKLKNFDNIGSFGSTFDLSKLNIKEPVIISSTDGVGTKIEIANQLNKFDTIGIDLVAMCVNDLLVQGGRPIFFLDYISINNIKLSKVKNIIKGIVNNANQLMGKVKIIFLENYNMWLGHLITSGVDIWLNTPLRPNEASGTSGMKAALIGVPNLSILDGWWVEGCKHRENGWAIGSPDACDDKSDSESLYQILENEVIPTFYKNNEKWNKSPIKY